MTEQEIAQEFAQHQAQENDNSMTAKELIALDKKFMFITGEAGSGKTWLVREAIKLNPKWGMLTATTGAAAQVLSNGSDEPVKTINSALGFFAEDSIFMAMKRGSLRKTLKYFKTKYEHIVIDECSMLKPGILAPIIYECAKVGMGLVLVGDFLQLPPVEKNHEPAQGLIFDMPQWEQYFEPNSIRLTTQYRQQGDFLKAMNCLRAGKGAEAIPLLKSAGAHFLPQGDKSYLDIGTQKSIFAGKTYSGTTMIVATNARRDLFNQKAYAALTGPEYVYETERDGEQSDDLAKIPNEVRLRVGARVMVLRNLIDPKTDAILQANGNTATVTALDDESVTLLRDDNQTIQVNMHKVVDILWHKSLEELADGTVRMKKFTHGIPKGTCAYMPLTLAWALTVHKTQGLTMPYPTAVLAEDFFKDPAMCYVALSRQTTASNLYLVGFDEYTVDFKTQKPVQVYPEPRLIKLCRMDKRCLAYV